MKPYLKFDNNFIKKKTRKEIFEPLSRGFKNLGIIPSKLKILDLGCGQGLNTLALSKHFHTVYGVDPSTKMLNFARNLRKKAKKIDNFDNVRFYLGDFENIPFNNLDVICLFNSIHFSKQINKDLNYFLSKIKKGGIILISEPHNKSIFGIKLMKNKKALKKKIQTVTKVRNKIKLFLKRCKENKKASIITESETEIKYFVLIQKL